MDEEKEYYSLVKNVFRRLAPFYDPATFFLAGLRHRAVDFTAAGKDSKILDIATGTGKQAFAFAKRGYSVTGIDLSEAMLGFAIKKNRFKNAKFQIADATSLPFENCTFDVSSVSFALHDMPPSIRTRALSEITRVTRPEGIILIVDYSLPKNRLGRFLVYHFVRLYEGKYYSEFIKSDLEALLHESGIEIKAEVRQLFGAVRILKARKM